MRVVLFASALLLMVLSGCLSGEPKVEATDEDSGASCTGSANATSASVTCSSGSKSSSKSGSASGTSTNGPGSGNATGNATANNAPVIQSFTANVTGLSVSFLINGTDADGNALTYVVAFGDNSTNATGTLANGVGNATHTFAGAGTYNATLTISDGKASANKTIAVTASASGIGGGEPRSYTCTMTIGTAGPSLRGDVNIGACSMGDTAEAVVVTAIDVSSGCTAKYATGGSSSWSGNIEVGQRYETATEFGLTCGLPGLNGEGTVTATTAAE